MTVCARSAVVFEDLLHDKNLEILCSACDPKQRDIFQQSALKLGSQIITRVCRVVVLQIENLKGDETLKIVIITDTNTHKYYYYYY